MGLIYRCLIIDDETPAHKALVSHISKFDDLEYSGSAFNGAEAIKMLKENKYDIIFLDINMPVISGVELMELQPNRPLTIVTTAYSDFALSAYQNDAIDYLLKPIALEKFAKAIEKAKTYFSGNSLLKDDDDAKSRYFSYRVNGQVSKISLAEIIYIESLGNYLKLYGVKLSFPIIIYGSLASVASELDNPDFVQVHRSYVINRNLITGITLNTVVMQNGKVIPLGRKYKILLDSFK